MKIKSYQSGGIVYLPTINRGTEAAQQPAASTSSSKGKVPGFADKIIDMVRENGIDTDVDTFLNQVNMALDLAGDPTGENISMKEILRLAGYANRVKNNKESYDVAVKSLEAQEAWGDVAVDNHGSIYAYNNESGELEHITSASYLKNKGLYTPLTNEDLLNQRRGNPKYAYNNEMLDDLSKAVGTTTIINYVNDLISNFKETEITGYAAKQKDKVASGLREIVDGVLSGGNSIVGAIEAGPDGVYKIAQSSTKADTDLNEALNYLIHKLPPDYALALQAKAAVEGFNPNALLLEMITSETHRKITADYDNQATELVFGKKSGSSAGSNSEVKHTLAESYADGAGLNPPTRVSITPQDSTTSLFAYAQNAGPIYKDDKGTPMPIANLAQVYEDAYALRSDTSNTVSFGDQLIDRSQLGGLVYDGSDMYRVVLPAKTVNGKDIVPDFELQEKLDDIIKNAQDQGADASTINRYIQEACPGAVYDEKNGQIVLPRDKQHVFLTFGASAADNFIEFSKDSEYLVKSDMNPDVYREATQYGYANHKKNDPKRTEGSAEIGGLGWWFPGSRTSNHLYKGNVFIPVTSSMAGTLAYNQGYIPKSAYSNITGRTIEHEREMQVRERLTNPNNTNWGN